MSNIKPWDRYLQLEHFASETREIYHLPYNILGMMFLCFQSFLFPIQWIMVHIKIFFCFGFFGFPLILIIMIGNVYKVELHVMIE